MAIYNSMLNIMPYNCRYCIQGWFGMQHISNEAIKQGVNLIELEKGQAEKTPVWETLAAQDPIFVNGFGHGNNDVYTGDSETPIFTSNECDILAHRVVYLLSCLTANGLGSAIINAGGIAYGGFNISWTWMTNSVEVDPYIDWYAEGFYRSSNEFPIALIQTETVARARDRSIAEYSRWVNIWETERSDDIHAAETIKWLIHDRDGLIVLGNLDEIVAHPGTRTVMNVKVEPPTTARPGNVYPFSGTLAERDTGTPLLNEIIQLWFEGETEPSKETTTDASGGWNFDLTFEPGINRVYARFIGNEHVPSVTPAYTVEVSLTIMTDIEPPPSRVEARQPFSLLGVLTDKQTGLGIPNKPIYLWEENTIEPIATTTTDADGRWSFTIVKEVGGIFVFYVEFPGDVEHYSSSTPKYEVAVTHTLSINTTPITKVSFWVNGTKQTTPWSGELIQGKYFIELPWVFVVEGINYNFKRWDDGYEFPLREIDLLGDTLLTVIYEAGPIPEKIINTYKIISSIDDGENLSYYNFNSTGNYLQLNFRCWLRYALRFLPARAKIWSARIKGHGERDRDYPSKVGPVQIQHTDEDDAAEFSSNPYYRPVSGPIMEWMLPNPWKKGMWYLVYISELIQDFVNRPEYLEGNRIAIRIDRAGNPVDYQQFTSYDRDPELAAEIEVTWSPPGIYHTLTITSDPITGVPVTIDAVPVSKTPVSMLVTEGEHMIEVVEEVNTNYRFQKWEDNSTNPKRAINIKSNMALTAYYKEVTRMTVIFSGTVSAQEAAGEAVTITVTLPGGGTEKVSTPTLADKTFSIEYTNAPGDYTAKAKIEADSLYEAAESKVVPFVIGKEPRTITLLVTPK